MKTEKIGSWTNCHIDLALFKLPNGKTRRYSLVMGSTIDSVVIAYFDTEEKARLYFEGCIKGCEIGYGSGWDSCLFREGSQSQPVLF